MARFIHVFNLVASGFIIMRNKNVSFLFLQLVVFVNRKFIHKYKYIYMYIYMCVCVCVCVCDFNVYWVAVFGLPSFYFLLLLLLPPPPLPPPSLCF